MAKTAVVFSNGTVNCEMAEKLYNKYESAKEIYDKGAEILGYDIVHTPADTLSKKQVANFAFAISVNKILKDNLINIEAFTGYSLGEIVAICAANGLTLEEAFKVISIRGEFMGKVEAEDGNQNAFHTFGMFRVAWSFIEKISKEAVRDGDLQFADFNLYSNVSGLMYKKFTYLPDYIRLQMCMPILWRETLNSMFMDGIDSVISVGTDNEFADMMKDANGYAQIYKIDSADSLENTISLLK